LPKIITPVQPAEPAVKSLGRIISTSISTKEYSDHIQLSINQLETVTLMLAVLEQTDDGPAPTE